MAITKIKATREITSSTAATEPLTDEIYAKMSRGNKILINLAEAAGIEVLVSTYNGNYYLAVATLDEVVDTYFK